MSPTYLAAIAAPGFAVAFLHAALPTHWLPFVLVGRARGWGPEKTLTVTALAGSGHVAATALLGVLVTTVGQAAASHLGAMFPRFVGAMLGALGVYYLVQQVRRHRHEHGEGAAKRLAGGSDLAAIVGLIALLTFSPCETFLPVYLANVRYGWLGFTLLSLVLAFGAVAAMLLFTGLCLAGADRLRLERLERYEAAVIGLALCGLGVFVALEG